MVNRGYDIEFELTIRCGLEDSGVNLDFLNARAVELLQGCDYPGLLSCARWTVDKEMREISTLCLVIQFSMGISSGIASLQGSSDALRAPDDMSRHLDSVAYAYPLAAPSGKMLDSYVEVEPSIDDRRFASRVK